MDPGTNVWLQAGAFAAFWALRLLTPGWLLFAFGLTIVGPVLTITPLILSAVALRHDALPPMLAAPFIVCAASLLAIGLFTSEVDQNATRIPVFGRLDTKCFPKWIIRLTTATSVLSALTLCGALCWTAITLIAAL